MTIKSQLCNHSNVHIIRYGTVCTDVFFSLLNAHTRQSSNVALIMRDHFTFNNQRKDKKLAINIVASPLSARQPNIQQASAKDAILVIVLTNQT